MKKGSPLLLLLPVALVVAVASVPLSVALLVAAVATPAVGTIVDCLETAGSSPTTVSSSEASTADDGEGGVGFDLPRAGTPRRTSLSVRAASIPAGIKKLYVAAGERYKVPWTLLAGIGMVETAHGTRLGISPAGARGLMQFMPATFAAYGVDGDHDGRAWITSAADSVYSAANYLTATGVTRGVAGVRQALFAYNHADWYVNDVLHYAHAYGGGTVLGDPTDTCPTGDGNPQLPPLEDDRIAAVLAFAADQAGDRYIMGANGPAAWDCSSLVQAAYAKVGVSLPRTAAAQRNWLAAGHGYRVSPGEERPGDLVFWDSYRGPNVIGHVMLVWDPASKTTIEARGRRAGVGHFSYASGREHHVFEIWRPSAYRSLLPRAISHAAALALLDKSHTRRLARGGTTEDGPPF